ncbi:hypothetical protein EDEG_05077 [Edhazardia aedis USNM 41457]|uniref:Uncharacterized protein n=1 Tax=Edhazardia aedis (strain USNM 41457) TaxID=1003232 RepID=A0A0L1P661_EDHAE|nr:hypothetical protein EDEG_05077 [Edhazardia aedis USNM 41457]|eukprot:KNH48540.1 hypothetical protein EDEG_05077 [Edhazardia aedis USNM 41457]
MKIAFIKHLFALLSIISTTNPAEKFCREQIELRKKTDGMRQLEALDYLRKYKETNQKVAYDHNNKYSRQSQYYENKLSQMGVYGMFGKNPTKNQ